VTFLPIKIPISSQVDIGSEDLNKTGNINK
jgi:hypothetical protein